LFLFREPGASARRLDSNQTPVVYRLLPSRYCASPGWFWLNLAGIALAPVVSLTRTGGYRPAARLKPRTLRLSPLI
jgi:hypothetical protein